jgi:ferredoxin
VTDFEDREVNGLKVRIDRALCVGFGDCVTGAPEAFKMADDGIVVFVAPEQVGREQLLEACDACPVDALTVWNGDGEQLVPS